MLLFGFMRILKLMEQTSYGCSDFYSTWEKKKKATLFPLSIQPDRALYLSSSYFSSVLVINGTLQGAVIKLS